jgi:hypothetical protein
LRLSIYYGRQELAHAAKGAHDKQCIVAAAAADAGKAEEEMKQQAAAAAALYISARCHLKASYTSSLRRR